MTLETIIASARDDFSVVTALTDAYVPACSVWVGDYPYLDKNKFKRFITGSGGGSNRSGSGYSPDGDGGGSPSSYDGGGEDGGGGGYDNSRDVVEDEEEDEDLYDGSGGADVRRSGTSEQTNKPHRKPNPDLNGGTKEIASSKRNYSAKRASDVVNIDVIDSRGNLL